MKSFVRVTRMMLERWVQQRSDILLQQGERAAAKDEADQLSTEASADVPADLGDLFGRHGELSTADAHFDRARELTGNDQRIVAALYLRQASWHEGESRWKLLMEAAERQPGNKPARNSLLLTILEEAQSPSDAEVLGRLAAAAKHPIYRTRLRMRQARLTPDRSEAGRLCRELLESGRAGPDEEPWMLRRLIESGETSFVIDLLESRLRDGKTLSNLILRRLASAYKEAGETAFARRATSQLHEHPHRRHPPRRQPSRGPGFF